MRWTIDGAAASFFRQSLSHFRKNSDPRLLYCPRWVHERSRRVDICHQLGAIVFSSRLRAVRPERETLSMKISRIIASLGAWICLAALAVLGCEGDDSAPRNQPGSGGQGTSGGGSGGVVSTGGTTAGSGGMTGSGGGAIAAGGGTGTSSGGASVSGATAAPMGGSSLGGAAGAAAGGSVGGGTSSDGGGAGAVSADAGTGGSDAGTGGSDAGGSIPLPTKANSIAYIGCSMAFNIGTGYKRVGGKVMWNADSYQTSAMVVQNWTDPNSASWRLFDQKMTSIGGRDVVKAIMVQICIFSSRATNQELKSMIAAARQHVNPGTHIYMVGQPQYEAGHDCILAGTGGAKWTDDEAKKVAADSSINQDLTYLGQFMLDSTKGEVSFDSCHASESGEDALGKQAIAFFGG
jgi:hypothetical protein